MTSQWAYIYALLRPREGQYQRKFKILSNPLFQNGCSASLWSLALRYESALQ